MKYLLIILMIVFVSCSDNSVQNNNAAAYNANIKPSPLPTAEISKEEKEKQVKEDSDKKTKAIGDFLAANYKGWKLEGVTDDDHSSECTEFSPCDLHLINGSQSKVITIIIKLFYKKDGTVYWVVREARQIDLAKLKINEIKESEKEVVLENLDYDICSDICEREHY